MRLWIFLSTDNVLTLQQYGTGCGGGSIGRVNLVGAEI